MKECRVTIDEMQRPWPSVKKAKELNQAHSMPTREVIDSLTHAAMQEVSDALLNDRSTDWNGNPISSEMMDSLNGVSELPTRGIIVDLGLIGSRG